MPEDRSVSHKTFVEKLCVCAEGRAKLLHQITKPYPLRGGASVAIPQEDAENEAGLQAEFKEWHAHWKVWLKVQEQEKFWDSVELGQQEEALAPLRVGALRSGSCRIPSEGRVPLDLSDDCCGKILTLLHKVEMAGVWSANASTTLSFWYP